MLGFWYVKLAATAPAPATPPTAFRPGEETEPSETAKLIGPPATTYSAQGLPAVTGTGTMAQGLTAFAMDNFGDVGAFAGPLLQVITPFLPQSTRDWLTKQRRFAAGAGTTGEAQQISSALSAANAEMMRKNGEVMSSRMAEFVNSLPKDGVGGAIRQYGGQLIAMAGARPDITGKLIMMLRQMDTPITPLLNQFLGDIPTSYTPIVQSVFADNGGKFNREMLQSRVAEFDQALSSGAFTSREVQIDANGQPVIDPATGQPKYLPMTADTAMGAFGLAADVLGRNATLPQRVELARMAQTIMNRGLAKTSQAAYVILRSMNPHEALADPQAFDQKLVNLSERLKGLGGDAPNQVLGAAEMAVRGRQPLEHVLAKVVREGEAEKVWMQSGRSPEQIASYKNLNDAVDASRTKGFEEAESTKGLTAYVMESAEGRDLYQRFLADPDPQKSAELFARARNSKSWANREAYDPRSIQAEMSPDHMEALQLGEQATFTRELKGSNGSLARIMADPEKYRDLIENPTNLSNQSQSLYKSLSFHDKQYLQNPALRGMLIQRMAALDAEDMRSKTVGDQDLSLTPYKKVTPDQLMPKAPVEVEPVEPAEPVAIKPPKLPATPEVPGVRTSQT